MSDPFVLAKSIADIRDAVQRIREVLPADVARFQSDRTAKEVVVLNLFVALQHCLSIATHWLADGKRDVPGAYRQAFVLLAERGVLDAALGARLAAAMGLRNLIAHRYGDLDWRRIHELACVGLDDLLEFCAQIEARAAGR